MMARLAGEPSVTPAARPACPPYSEGDARTPNSTTEIAAHLSLLAADYERHGLSPPTPVPTRAALSDRSLSFTKPIATSAAFLSSTASRKTWLTRFGNSAAIPAFAAAAILTLALGIGANAAIYQVLDAVVFRSLPVRDPASLVQVQLLENEPAGPRQLSLISAVGRRATGLRRHFSR